MGRQRPTRILLGAPRKSSSRVFALSPDALLSPPGWEIWISSGPGTGTPCSVPPIPAGPGAATLVVGFELFNCGTLFLYQDLQEAGQAHPLGPRHALTASLFPVGGAWSPRGLASCQPPLPASLHPHSPAATRPHLVCSPQPCLCISSLPAPRPPLQVTGDSGLVLSSSSSLTRGPWSLVPSATARPWQP